MFFVLRSQIRHSAALVAEIIPMPWLILKGKKYDLTKFIIYVHGMITSLLNVKIKFFLKGEKGDKDLKT